MIEKRVTILEEELQKVLSERDKHSQMVQTLTRDSYKLLGAIQERKEDLNKTDGTK